MTVAPALHEYVLHLVDLNRYSAWEAQRVVSMLKGIAADVAAKIAATPDARLNTERIRRLRQLGEEVRGVLAGSMADLSNALQTDFVSLGRADATWTAQWLQGWSGAAAFDPSITLSRVEQIMGAMEIEGVAWSDWWASQADTTWRRFQREMRLGVMQGETMPELAGRVLGRVGIEQGVFGPTRANAMAIARTGVNQLVGDIRRDLYQSNPDTVAAIEQVSTLDAHTTEICRQYDGARWSTPDMEPIGHSLEYGGGVPRHWGCRSSEVPVVRLPNGQLMAPGGRASATGPVPGDFNYGQWLDSLDDDQIRGLIGEKQFNLYKSGKLPLSEAFRHQYSRPKRPPWAGKKAA
jgi:hypothetical protein